MSKNSKIASAVREFLERVICWCHKSKARLVTVVVS